MRRNLLKTKSGFTLIELMVTMAITVIFFLGVAVALVDSQRAWGNLYGKVHTGVAPDGFVAKKNLDSVIRKASSDFSSCTVDEDGQWVEVHYFNDDDSTALDRYAKFYVSDDELLKETGTLEPREELYSETICSNVSDCTFKKVGGAIQMILHLDDGDEQSVVVTCSRMNNP